MYIKTVSREELKTYYNEVRGNIEPSLDPKIEIDLEPIVRLFNKIMTMCSDTNDD